MSFKSFQLGFNFFTFQFGQIVSMMEDGVM